MKDRFETWQYIKAFLFIAFIITLVVLILTSCVSSKTVAARQPATLINSEKVSHSTNYLICIQAKDGTRYSGYFNSHHWKGDRAVIPANWYVATNKNGKSFIQPVQ